MPTTLPNTAKSARRRLLLTLLGVLGTLAVAGGIGVNAAGGSPDFSLATSPSSAAVMQGKSATVTVTVNRVNGFTGAVTLSAANLPAGATAMWKLPNGTATNVVPSDVNAATLTVAAAKTTPLGTYSVSVQGTSGKLTRSAKLTLAVQKPSAANFTIGATPSSQTVLQGDSASYGVTIARANGFDGPVALSATGLPGGTTASFSPSGAVAGSAATMTLATTSPTSQGTHTVTVVGTGTIDGAAVSRSAIVTLVVTDGHAFRISGDLAQRLVPGRRVPLELTFVNDNNFPLQVSNLAVAIEEQTTARGCSGTRNFRVTQLSGALTIPAGTSRLGALVADSARWPQVEMLNLDSNQDACRNARITLQYSGTGTK